MFFVFSSQAAPEDKWRVYLVSTYAEKAKDVVAPGLVINVAQFRTATSSCKIIIVDSPTQDIAFEIKEEMSDSVTDVHDKFAKIYGQSKPTEAVNEKTWVPLVSLSAKWRAPADLSELNKTLYIRQPSIPKYEGTSRTVKM